MIEWLTLTVTPVAQNARIVWVQGDTRAVLIDPGGDVRSIERALATSKLQCTEIWLTHSHFDHCGGVAALRRGTGAVLRAHPNERILRSRVVDSAEMFGIPPGDMENCPEPDHPLVGGEILEFCGEQFEVRFTPGHSPGHLVFLHRASGTLFAGDTVFAGSIGRTDLPGGDHATLLASIRDQVLSLPDSSRILPGHGPETTVGVERRTNPFLAAVRG